MLKHYLLPGRFLPQRTGKRFLLLFLCEAAIIKPIVEMSDPRLKEEGLPWATQGSAVESPNLKHRDAWAGVSIGEILPLAVRASLGHSWATLASLTTLGGVSFLAALTGNISHIWSSQATSISWHSDP